MRSITQHRFDILCQTCRRYSCCQSGYRTVVDSTLPLMQSLVMRPLLCVNALVLQFVTMLICRCNRAPIVPKPLILSIHPCSDDALNIVAALNAFLFLSISTQY